MEPQPPPPPLGGITPYYVSPQSEATANLYKHAVAAARIVQKQHQQKQQQQLRSKRYLQISEVVNSMKDLIDYSRETGAGPMESLAKYPRRTNPSPLFQSQASHTSLSGAPLVNSPSISMQQQQPALSGAADANDTQSTVQKIIHDMMMSSQLGGDARNVNGVMSADGNIGFINGGNNILMGTGVANGGNSIGLPGFGSTQNGPGQPGMVNGIRAAFANNNSVSMNGRAVGMNLQQQQDMSHQLLNRLGAVNEFNNLQFDWENYP